MSFMAGGRWPNELRGSRRRWADDPFVFGINYRMPSEAAFYLPGRPQTYALFLHYKASEYLFWENSDSSQRPRRGFRQ